MNTPLKTSVVAILFACISFLYAEEPKAYVPETTTVTSSETFRSRVLRVHHFVEADFEYVAYTINWRGHEVVVSASYIDKILKVGDEIRCQMQSTPVKIGSGKKAEITFSVHSNADLRLNAIRGEVARRRASREMMDNPGAKQLEKKEPNQSLEPTRMDDGSAN